MTFIKKSLSYTGQDSYTVRMRRKRFALFLKLLEDMAKPVKILDVGGTQMFWQIMGFTNQAEARITLLNLDQQETTLENFTSVVGDATNLVNIQDEEFDLVFSNSVIEHVGDYHKQQLMAQEVQRVGKRYFVQTPNYFFPIEPHFLFLGFHWLPVSTRAFLINHFDLGWMKRVPDVNEARNVVKNIRLLRKKELLSLFLEAELYEEKFFGLTKSFIAYKV
jgi:2-polyprenyl-3-methyl-5-hydroxy-6-metoxy-1,4-benzoquinol methylase